MHWWFFPWQHCRAGVCYNQTKTILARTLRANVNFILAKTESLVIAQHCSSHKEAGEKHHHVCWAYGLGSQLILALFLDLCSRVSFCFFLSKLPRKNPGPDCPKPGAEQQPGQCACCTVANNLKLLANQPRTEIHLEDK